MPYVSVVIPTYNRKVFVIEALESVLAQTFGDFEVIVIDDGSNDGTEQALRAFAGRVRYFYQPNGGVSSARNHGIRRANADLIAFLDSDDLWDKQFLEVTTDYLKKYPDIAMVCTGWRTLPSGHCWPPLKERLLVGKLFPRLVQTRIIRTSAVVARRGALLDAGLFNEQLAVAEDLDMWLRLTSRHRTAFLNVHLSWGRRHDQRLSKNRTLHLERQLQVLETHFDPTLAPRSIFDRRRAELYVDLGKSHLKANHVSAARACYRKALVLNPYSWRALRHMANALFAQRERSGHI